MYNKINIVYITDDNYINTTIMSIFSLFKTIKKRCNVYVLCDFSKQDSYDIVKNSCNEFNIKLINASNYIEQYKKNIVEYRHVTVSAILKFFLAEIFIDQDYLLYLDSDTIINKDITDLFNIDINSNYAAVVKDTLYFVNRNHLNKFNINNKYYFNSGVMFLNLKKLREDKISKKLVEYKLSHNSNFMDQDAFNAVLGSNVKYISWKYNFLPFYTKRLNLDSLSYMFDYDFRHKDLKEIIDDSIIIHFGGPDKPWKYNQGILSAMCLSYMSMANISVPKLNNLPYYENFKFPCSPAISVLIPCLNSDLYLCECIESIINQTFQDIEIIFIDAGSTDNTLNIINKYAKKDYRIHIIHSKIKSYGHQLNLGLNAAKGEYIAIVESDDYISNKMFEEQYYIAKKYKVDFIKANYKIFYGIPSERKFTYIDIDKSKKFYNKVVNARKNLEIFNTNLVIWTGIYNKAFLDKNKIRFNESLGASYQDNGFYFQTYCMADKIWFMTNDYYRLRRDNPNSSVKNKNKVYAMCDEYKFIEKFVKENFPDDKKIYRIYLKKKKQNYLWNLTRIAEEYKKEFLKKFSADFKNDLINGDICTPFFSKQEIETVTKIVKDSDNYYKEYTNIRLDNIKNRLIKWYLIKTNSSLDLNAPKTYNEKIQWLKLYDSTIRKTYFSDLLSIKNIMKIVLGEQYIQNPLCVYKNEQYIDFDLLPKKFIIYCSHGENYKIVVSDKDKIDIDVIKLKLRGWLSEDYSEINGFELYYKNINPYIIVDDLNELLLSSIDYYLWCFDGKTEFIQVLDNKEMKSAFYDTHWKRKNFLFMPYTSAYDIPIPDFLDELIDLGNKASKSFAHVIVNFKIIKSKIYFKKLLFSYNSGIVHWENEEMNIKMGEFINLPTNIYNVFTKKYQTDEEYLSYISNLDYNNKNKSLTQSFINKENSLNNNLIKNKQNKYISKIDIGDLNIFDKIKECNFEKIKILGINFIRKEKYFDREHLFFFNIPIYYKRIKHDIIRKRILFFNIYEKNK